jgi:hypothetical protein
MAHQRLQGDDVVAAFAEEPVGETIAKLVRRKRPHVSSLANSPHHPHQGLAAVRRAVSD